MSTAMAPTRALAAKTARHPAASVIAPPMMGPSPVPTPAETPHSPMARARSRVSG